MKTETTEKNKLIIWINGLWQDQQKRTYHESEVEAYPTYFACKIQDFGYLYKLIPIKQ